MDRIIGHYLTATMKIIKSIGFLRMDIGHMLLFGVIAMTFLWEGPYLIFVTDARTVSV